MSDNLKVANDSMRKKFEDWCESNGIHQLSTTEVFGGGYIADSTEVRWEAWQAAIASQQAAHDAEIAKLKSAPMKYKRMEFNAQLQAELSAANAACAMNDEVLNSSKKLILGINGVAADICLRKIDSAISASQQQVSKWEAEKLEPLRAQVAMLHTFAASLLCKRCANGEERVRIPHVSGGNVWVHYLKGALTNGGDVEKGCGASELHEFAANTQATAEQFIAECEQRGAVKAHQEYMVIGALHKDRFYAFPPFPEGSKLLYDRATSKKQNKEQSK